MRRFVCNRTCAHGIRMCAKWIQMQQTIVSTLFISNLIFSLRWVVSGAILFLFISLSLFNKIIFPFLQWGSSSLLHWNFRVGWVEHLVSAQRTSASTAQTRHLVRFIRAPMKVNRKVDVTQNYSYIYPIEQLVRSFWVGDGAGPSLGIHGLQSIWSDIALKCNHVSVSLIASSKMKIVLIFISHVYECIIRQAFSFDMKSFLSRLFLLSFVVFLFKFISLQSLGFTIFSHALRFCSLWCGYACKCAAMPDLILFCW